LFKYGTDEGEWIGILYSPGVEGLIVYDGAKFTVLLFSEEK